MVCIVFLKSKESIPEEKVEKNRLHHAVPPNMLNSGYWKKRGTFISPYLARDKGTPFSIPTFKKVGMEKGVPLSQKLHDGLKVPPFFTHFSKGGTFISGAS